jgi:hypothetical protein
MKTLVNVNLTARTSDWVPPTLTFGESLTLAFAFTKNVNGNQVAPNLTFSGCQGAIGPVDARPLGGTTCLGIGAGPFTVANTTSPLNYNASAKEVAAAVNALTAVTALYGTCKVIAAQGSWLLFFGTGSTQVPIAPVNNLLWPVSFVDVMAWPQSGQWVQAVRFVQAPVSFTSDHSVVLPNPPVITRVQGGEQIGNQLKPEIQQLYIPPDFLGAFTINYNTDQQTSLLNPTSSPSDIQAALVAAVGAGITVTLPQNFTDLITFGGDFAGEPQNLMTVTVQQAPPGNLTITLPLDRAELATALRIAGQPMTLPLQVQVTASEDGGDPQVICALVLPVTIQPSLITPSMETTPTTDWLVPPSPTSYTPFGAENVLTTGQAYAHTEGDGASTSFALTHGLDTDDLRVFVRQNGDPGYQLDQGADYKVQVNSTAQVTVSALPVTVTGSSVSSPNVTLAAAPPLGLAVGSVLLGSAVTGIAGNVLTLAANASTAIATPTPATPAPAANAWRVQVFSAQTIAQWAAGLTVTIAQVIGLRAELDAIEANLAQLNQLLPAVATLPGSTTANATITRAIAPASGILFAPPSSTAANLPIEAPFILQSINRVNNDGALPGTLPAPSPLALYTVSSKTQIAGDGRIPDTWAQPGEFVGSDGRTLYVLQRDGTKNTYVPKPFQFTLFDHLYFDDMIVVPGNTITLWFGLVLGLIHGNTSMKWTLVIEQGALMTEALYGSSSSSAIPWQTPSSSSGSSSSSSGSSNSAALNLEGINWNTATPLVKYPLDVSNVPQTHWFGCAIARSTAGFTANGMIYNRVLANNAAAPATPFFAIRARLINADATLKEYGRGWVSWALQAAPNSQPLGATIN